MASSRWRESPLAQNLQEAPEAAQEALGLGAGESLMGEVVDFVTWGLGPCCWYGGSCGPR